MQPNPNSNQPKAQAEPNINLSHSDLLPDVFDEMPPTLKMLSQPNLNPAAVSAKPQLRPQAREWVAANFEQLAAPTTELPTTPSASLKRAPTLTRLHHSLPMLNRVKAGQWLIFVAIVLVVISILGLLAWLYYNSILGAVPPSNR